MSNNKTNSKPDKGSENKKRITYNPKIPAYIKEILKNDQEKKLVFFLGAGTSMLMGAKSWDDIAYDLSKRCYEKKIISYKEFEHFKSSNDPKKIISVCRIKLRDKEVKENKKHGIDKKPEEKDYFEVLGNAFKPNPNKEKFNIYKLLREVPAVFVTTNIDTLFDDELCSLDRDINKFRKKYSNFKEDLDSFKKSFNSFDSELNNVKNKNYYKSNENSEYEKKLNSFEKEFSNNVDDFLYYYPNKYPKRLVFKDIKNSNFKENGINRGYLYKLHGCIEYRESIVFTVSEYLKKYNDLKVIEFLKELFDEDKYIIFFIGYGLSEFEVLDHLITKIYKETDKKSKEEKYSRFILKEYYKNDEAILKSDEEYYNELGIGVIPYAKDEIGYEQIYYILKDWIEDKIKTLGPYYSDRLKYFKGLINDKEYYEAFSIFELNRDDETIKSILLEELKKTKFLIDWLNVLDDRGVFEPLDTEILSYDKLVNSIIKTCFQNDMVFDEEPFNFFQNIYKLLYNELEKRERVDYLFSLTILFLSAYFYEDNHTHILKHLEETASYNNSFLSHIYEKHLEKYLKNNKLLLVRKIIEIAFMSDKREFEHIFKNLIEQRDEIASSISFNNMFKIFNTYIDKFSEEIYLGSINFGFFSYYYTFKENLIPKRLPDIYYKFIFFALTINRNLTAECTNQIRSYYNSDKTYLLHIAVFLTIDHYEILQEEFWKWVINIEDFSGMFLYDYDLRYFLEKHCEHFTKKELDLIVEFFDKYMIWLEVKEEERSREELEVLKEYQRCFFYDVLKGTGDERIMSAFQYSKNIINNSNLVDNKYNELSTKEIIEKDRANFYSFGRTKVNQAFLKILEDTDCNKKIDLINEKGIHSLSEELMEICTKQPEKIFLCIRYFNKIGIDKLTKILNLSLQYYEKAERIRIEEFLALLTEILSKSEFWKSDEMSKIFISIVLDALTGLMKNEEIQDIKKEVLSLANTYYKKSNTLYTVEEKDELFIKAINKKTNSSMAYYQILHFECKPYSLLYKYYILAKLSKDKDIIEEILNFIISDFEKTYSYVVHYFIISAICEIYYYKKSWLKQNIESIFNFENPYIKYMIQRFLQSTQNTASVTKFLKDKEIYHKFENFLSTDDLKRNYVFRIYALFYFQYETLEDENSLTNRILKSKNIDYVIFLIKAVNEFNENNEKIEEDRLKKLVLTIYESINNFDSEKDKTKLLAEYFKLINCFDEYDKELFEKFETASDKFLDDFFKLKHLVKLFVNNPNKLEKIFLNISEKVYMSEDETYEIIKTLEEKNQISIAKRSLSIFTKKMKSPKFLKFYEEFHKKYPEN